MGKSTSPRWVFASSTQWLLTCRTSTDGMWLTPGVLKMGCDTEVSRLVNSWENGQRGARWEHLEDSLSILFPTCPTRRWPQLPSPRALGFTLTYLLRKTQFGKITFLPWSSVPFCVNSASSLSRPAVRSARATLVKTLACAFPLDWRQPCGNSPSLWAK